MSIGQLQVKNMLPLVSTALPPRLVSAELFAILVPFAALSLMLVMKVALPNIFANRLYGMSALFSCRATKPFSYT